MADMGAEGGIAAEGGIGAERSIGAEGGKGAGGGAGGGVGGGAAGDIRCRGIAAQLWWHIPAALCIFYARLAGD